MCSVGTCCVRSCQILLINQFYQMATSFTTGALLRFILKGFSFICRFGKLLCMLKSVCCPLAHVNLMDSLAKPVISKELQELVQAQLGPNFQGISNIPVQQQMNVSDCGVFSIAYPTCLVYGQNPRALTFDSRELKIQTFLRRRRCRDRLRLGDIDCACDPPLPSRR